MTSRLTSELAVDQIGNRFDLVLVASQRARELQNGSAPRVNGVHGKYIATALKEIEEGHIGIDYLKKVVKQRGH
jgi:DNA-directed RNA polymerase subunit omega